MFRALMTSRRSGESPSILVFSLRALWRVLFRLEVAGWENLASAGAPNIVVVDHVSWLDAPILFSLMETPAIRDRARRSQELASAALLRSPMLACSIMTNR
jgi:hypothetical protein